jgi:hypothetical protein
MHFYAGMNILEIPSETRLTFSIDPFMVGFEKYCS